ncbi:MULTISPECIES: hypothetical protein [Thalassolituus]|jgi:hypothetical protein|uniref:Uncharacterized protein n=1 Tax=hydrothermal vent metagenome TaxID=652676 RepID=A0A160TEQ6_9ZZZZ|nr:hypothetical protein [Thalassolituus oleivorans]AHK17478.1 hypothetical protein R615_06820 [Thalassolituus oleivorans R6-15]MBQ0728022.1 hypothetical protein [Thalassolituus oleivorans]MCA6128999.1 hypothetical protein [Thalassolituus oleivorans 4BN06-13]MDF1641474.1 hypothetical protein [Thalassolituus oleivorans]
MTNVDLPQRPVELGDVLSLHEELHLIYRSMNSLYEFTEYHLVGKDAVLVAPVLGIIRDRLGRAGLRFEEVLSVPNGDQIF